MSCPYFKESYFGICVAQDAIHVPSIDEMERFCFRAWYSTCPNITHLKDPKNSGKTCAAGRRKGTGCFVWSFPAVSRDKGNS